MAEFVVMPGKQDRIKRERHAFSTQDFRWPRNRFKPDPYRTKVRRSTRQLIVMQLAEAKEGAMKKPIDPRIAAGMTGAVDPDVIIELETRESSKRPPRPGENPAKRHREAIRIIDQAIRSSIERRS